MRQVRRVLANDSGQSTVETAFAITALVSVLMIALAAIAGIATYLSVTDIAGHLARAHARQDSHAVEAMTSTLNFNATVDVEQDADTVTVTISVPLQLFDVTATATALTESSTAGEE